MAYYSGQTCKHSNEWKGVHEMTKIEYQIIWTHTRAI